MKLLHAGLTGAGLLLSTIAIFLAVGARGTEVASAIEAPAVPDPGVEALRSEVEALRTETRLLRAELSARPVEVAQRAPEAPARAERVAGETEDAEVGDLLTLSRKVVANEATPEEASRFWKRVRTSGVVDDLLGRVEAEVAAAPGDAEARMRLADAYIVKLFTVPAGPEMGLWGGKAEAEWREVLRLEPAHWQARFNLAVSLSYHPDVAGKTPEAIGELTRLVEQQEARAPEPRQADVYRMLAILHGRQGDEKAAKEALRRGLLRHPEDPKIKKALEGRR